ncbi:MAG: hypothetical protein V1659_04640 [Candidatus Woesearchaeota archaeon]
MEPQQINPGLNLQIPPDVKPVYADDAILLNAMKVSVNKEAKKDSVTKIPKLEILFYDRNTKTVVSRIVVDILTGKALGQILLADTEKLLKDMKSSDIPEELSKPKPKQDNEPSSTSREHDYIG